MKVRERQKEWSFTLPITADYPEEGLVQPQLNVISIALPVILQPEGILEP